MTEKELSIDKLSEPFKIQNFEKKWFLSPTFPFRWLCVGTSSSGKTSMILKEIIEHLDWDILYVFSKSLDQAKYKWLRHFCEQVEFNIYETLVKKAKKMGLNPDDVEAPIISHFSDDISNFRLEDLDNTKRNLILIDDFLPEMVNKKNQDIVSALFIRSRHFNTSVIFLTQNWALIPKVVRGNCSIFSFFNIPSKRQINSICYDLGLDYDNRQMAKLLNDATREKYSFLTIDTDQNELPLRYRKKMDHLLLEPPPEE
jgi:hypothetical protein